MNKRLILRDYHLREKAKKVIDDLPHDKVYEVVIREHKSNRSLAQNNLLWLWLTHISRNWHERGYGWYEPETWKMYFQRLMLGYKETVGPRNVLLSKLTGTSELNTKEFTQFLNDIDHYCGSELEIQLPRPEDVWLEAMAD